MSSRRWKPENFGSHELGCECPQCQEMRSDMNEGSRLYFVVRVTLEEFRGDEDAAEYARREGVSVIPAPPMTERK